ncbi:hypothetical protein ACA910_021482 [Epithemia clementina (nom. ined.)]
MLFLLSLLQIIVKSSSTNAHSPPNDGEGPSSLVADFVIVGGGTAGCVLTTRLCQELKGARIVVLEQGEERNEEEDLVTRALGLIGDLFSFYEPLMVLHPTEPNPSLFDVETGSFGRSIGMYEVKSMGGSSNVAFQWELPVEGTYESWGFDGLDSDTAHYYFNKVIKRLKPQQPPKELQHTYQKEFLNAYAAAGFDVLDTSGPLGSAGKTAYTNVLIANDKGERNTAWTAYLRPAIENECKHNVEIIQGAFVTDILVDHNDPSKVSGIKYSKDGSTKTILANKEVILSAGPYGTPRLLQVSGIGDRQVLAKAGVTSVKADLPVGLQTIVRPLGFVTASYQNPPLMPENNLSYWRTEETIDQFKEGKGGPLGVGFSAILGKFGDIAYHGMGSTVIGLPNVPIIGGGCILNAKSTGNVTIQRSDPHTPLTIHSNLMDGEDFGNMIQCASAYNDLLLSFPESFGMQLLNQDPNDPATLTQYLAAVTATSWHMVGGARSGSVIDGTSFKVYGFENLRVCDASAIPSLPVSAGPVSSVYVLSELFSEKLVSEYHHELGHKPKQTAEGKKNARNKNHDMGKKSKDSGRNGNMDNYKEKKEETYGHNYGGGKEYSHN